MRDRSSRFARPYFFFMLAALSACASAASPPLGDFTAQSAASVTSAARPFAVAPMTIKVSKCAAPTECWTQTGLVYVVFHGAAALNKKVTVTPQEPGYSYGYAVDYCVQKTIVVDGRATPIGDQLSECRNVSGYIDALDNVVDPHHQSSTQSLEFFGDGRAKPFPKNPIYNSLSFPIYPYGAGVPQNKTYGFVIQLHVHDAYGRFTDVDLQWCPSTACRSI